MIEIMQKAIDNEGEAQKMYRMGAEQAEDPETRSLFEQLANMEQAHERMLRDRLATLKLIRGNKES